MPLMRNPPGEMCIVSEQTSACHNSSYFILDKQNVLLRSCLHPKHQFDSVISLQVPLAAIPLSQLKGEA